MIALRFGAAALLAAFGLGLLLPAPLVRPLVRSAHAEESPLPVIDLHVDLPYQLGYKGRAFSLGSGEFRAAEIQAAGVAGVVLPLFVPKDAKPEGRSLRELEASYARVFSGILRTPPYSLPGCGVRRAGGESRSVETWLAFEGSEPLSEDVLELRRWTARGVRLFGLVHTEHNDLATSSGESSTGRGLSERGERFVRAAYEAGGIVDVSHASDASTERVLEIARELGRPVVATHSNARALAPHPRNLKDEHIVAIGRSGGVIGVNFHQRFLEVAQGRGATLEQVVGTIHHLVRLAGDSVVAIGSDFEGGIRPVPELSSAASYQVLGRALEKAGFSRKQVRAFLSGNARRVLCGGTRVLARGR